MKESLVKVVTAIGAIAYLEGEALKAGIDGLLFISAVGAISGLGGYKVLQDLKTWLAVKKGKKLGVP